MYILKDVTGKVRAEVMSLGAAMGRLGHGWTVWYRDSVLKTVDTQVLVKKDKVSKVRGSVRGCRVAGMHSELLTHKVDTGRTVEARVW